MKIALVADIHIGASKECGNYDSSSGMHSREIDFFHSLDQAIDFAIENEVDLFAILGDVFHSKNPTPTQNREYAKRICRLSEAKMETVILKGNHDTHVAEELGHTSSVIKELNVPYITIVDEPEILHYNDVAIIAMPYIHQGRGNRKKIEDVVEYYIETVEMLKSQSGSKKTICLAHQSVDKLRLSSEQEKDLSMFSEAVIPLEVFKDFDITFLGHIHKHQGVQKKPPVIYCGSIDKVDFGEASEEKGFMLYDTDTKEANFIKIDTREFANLKVDVSKNNKNISERIINHLKSLELENKIVKLTIKVKDSDIAQIDLLGIKKELKRSFYAKDLHYNIIKEKRSRNEQINETLSSAEALVEFIESRSEYKDYKIELIAEGKEVIKEIEDRKNDSIEVKA